MKTSCLNIDEVKKLYNELGSATAVAEHFSISRQTVCRFMNRNGIEYKKLRQLRIAKEDFEKAYNELKSTRKMAKKYGVSRDVIVRIARKYDIKLEARPPSERLVEPLRQMTKAGMDSFQIAEKLELTTEYINEVAREFGIKLNRRYHKGYIITHNGYRMIKDESSKDADSKGYAREHRRIAANKLGVECLPKNLIVHHINGDKLDNRADNLEVMTLSDHTRLHHKHQ